MCLQNVYTMVKLSRIKAYTNWITIMLMIMVLSGCCTKKLCVCLEAEVGIYANKDVNFYSIIRTDRNYTKIDSISNVNFIVSDKMQFYLLNKYSFDFKPNESIGDFNYIFKNSNTWKRDTISNILYDLEPYSFECNECFLTKDITYCNNIMNTKLTFNGNLMNEFKVTLD